MKKLAILFPGLGYTTDKPLLYYGKQLLREHQYEIYDVLYEAFEEKFTPQNTKDSVLDEKNREYSRQRMEAFVSKMVRNWTQKFGELPFEEYDQVLFLSKSIGTCIAAVCEKNIHCSPVHVLLTPLEQTFVLLEKDTKGIAFYGTQDPWSSPDVISAACKEHRIPLFLTENGNHSLETPFARINVHNLTRYVSQLEDFLNTLE